MYFSDSRYLARSPILERENGLEPLMEVNVGIRTFPRELLYYDFRGNRSPIDIRNAKILTGPDGFGCFFASAEEPYRSMFFSKRTALQEPYENATYAHCYALDNPERDLLLHSLDATGWHSSIVIDFTQDFDSLRVSSEYFNLPSLSLVEEPVSGTF